MVVSAVSNARFAFNNIDPNDPERKFSFMLIVNEQEKYDIVDCKPALDAADLVKLLQDLNETEDTSSLVRRMSKFFCAVLCGQQRLLVLSHTLVLLFVNFCSLLQ